MTQDTYLITAQQIEDMAAEPKVHFLNDRARRMNRSLGDVTGLTGLGFHIIDVEPGDETTEYHVHHFEDECVYVLSGTATVTIGDEDMQVGPGDFIGYRKGGFAHTMVNTGTEVLRCIVVGQRLPHDVGDYPRKGKRIYRNEGQPWELADHAAIEQLGGNVGKK
ncbi:MAG: cupin domain-containing protein [Paracoccaceae bacterium]